MRKPEIAVYVTAYTVVWEVGKCESRRQTPFMIGFYLLSDYMMGCPVTLPAEQYFLLESVCCLFDTMNLLLCDAIELDG